MPQRTVDYLHRCIPAPWRSNLDQGRHAPQLGDWLLNSRHMPPAQIMRVCTIKPNNIVQCLCYSVNSECIFSTDDPIAVRSLQPADLIRAQVIPHRQGYLCEGPADTVDYDTKVLHIDQFFNGKIVRTPLSASTVRGCCAALAHSQAKPATDRWSDTLPGNINWRRIWKWVWSTYRDRKVCDFLWRLLHKGLYLGHDRHHYAEDTSCPLCPDQEESYQHLLVDCPAIQRLWSWFSSVWHSVTATRLGHASLHTILLSSLWPSRVPKTSRARLTVLSIAHGELLYTLWLARCRALFDNDIDQLNIHSLAATACFRIDRALSTIGHHRRWSSDALSALSLNLSTAMHDPRHINDAVP